MFGIATPARRGALLLVASVTLFAACSDTTPVAPARDAVAAVQGDDARATTQDASLSTLRRASEKYHDLQTAIADGFVLLHPCEARPGEGPVGLVYVHPGRLLDGVIDPETPDALVYEPGKRPKLVAVEFAVPYAMWSGSGAPTFNGATFQPEDEFGVWALHAWVWRANPNGMYAQTNPLVSCGS